MADAVTDSSEGHISEIFLNYRELLMNAILHCLRRFRGDTHKKLVCILTLKKRTHKTVISEVLFRTFFN